jgi:hypothetical protein
MNTGKQDLTPKTWRVKGFRSLGADGSVEFTGTAFGPTEAKARKNFHRHFNAPAISMQGVRLPWRDYELTFTLEDGQ